MTGSARSNSQQRLSGRVLANTPDVRLVDDRLIVSTPRPDSLATRRALLRHWYSFQAHRIFPIRLDNVTVPFQRHNVIRPRLIIRTMSKRWGSFTPKGNLL